MTRTGEEKGPPIKILIQVTTLNNCLRWTLKLIDKTLANSFMMSQIEFHNYYLLSSREHLFFQEKPMLEFKANIFFLCRAITLRRMWSHIHLIKDLFARKWGMNPFLYK